MAAPIGNQNARNAKLWQQAIKRALARASGENIDKGLDKGADALVRSFIAGDQWAIKELGDRIDGKPVQGIEGPGANGEIIVMFPPADKGVL